MSDQQAAAPERPSRYDRSFGGLIAAMVVTVLLVAAYVGFRALISQQPDGRPDAVDYVTDVRGLQEGGVSVIYPRSLPAGWVPTSVDYDRGQHPLWSIGIVTAQDDFVGVVEQETPVATLLKSYVDPHYRGGPAVSVPSELGNSWETWSDAGGDHALSTTVDPPTGSGGSQTLLVYGSAPLKVQEQLLRLLTTARLPPRSPSDPVTESS